MTIILGIDPGSRITGYGVVRAERHQVSFVSCGSIRLGKTTLDDRLLMLFDELSNVIQIHEPVEAAVEKVFMHRNADSAIKLGQARGVAVVAARRAGLTIAEYSATQIKRTVVGRGHADKKQVQYMVKLLLGLEERPEPDAADALAAAICHSHMREGLAKLAFAGGTR